MTTRRDFFKTSAAALSCAAFSTLLIPETAFGANDKIRGAVFGLGGQGQYHANSYAKFDNVELAGLADADIKRAESMSKKLKDKTGRDVPFAQDPRQFLEDKNIDFVSIATCNHWHALLGIWAAQAGKHVYVEKPCSQNLFEGCRLADAMVKYKVCIQHGTQRRHDEGIKRGATAWAKGIYGKPVAVQAFANRPRNSMGFAKDSTPPENVNWDLWVGPAKMVPYSTRYIPYNWHWYWNFGNGEIGNNGVHYFDVCRIGLTQLFPGIKFPQNAVFFGTRIVNDKENNYKDGAETPTVQLGICDFNGIPLVFQSCNLRNRENTKWTPRETGQFVTEDGYINGSTFYGKNGKSESIKIDYQEPNPGGQFGNFLNCVADNTPEKLNAPITEGHFSAAVCHLGNISYRLGKTASLDACRTAVGNNPVMQKTVDETLDNVKFCLKGLDIEKDVTWTLGEKVSINNETQRFDDNAAANALLTRAERGAYVVPSEV